MDKLKQRQKKIQRKRKICLYVNNLSLRKKNNNKLTYDLIYRERKLKYLNKYYTIRKRQTMDKCDVYDKNKYDIQ